MIQCNEYNSRTYNIKHEDYKLRTLKLVGNAIMSKNHVHVKHSFDK